MADTRVQLEVEDWVRRNWMAAQFGTKFSRERLPLRSGGVFDFDAVSDDHSIVATISTSGAKTSGGKHAVGKILKLRSDSFSWFGLRGFKANGELRKLTRIPSVRPEALIETLEALLIVVVDPKLNSRKETLKGAMPLYQSQSDRPIDTEQRLEGIEKKLELLVTKSGI
jgi:hypothetical protein